MSKPTLKIRINNTIYVIDKLVDDKYSIKQRNKWDNWDVSYTTTEPSLKKLLYLENKHNKNKYFQFTLFFMQNDLETDISFYENYCDCLGSHNCNNVEFKDILKKYIYTQKNIFLKDSN